MPPENSDLSSGSAEPGSVELGHHEPGIAVVTMHGEHDIGTEPQLAYALAQAVAHSSVIVDLSDCSFIDSTVIASLIKGAATAREGGDHFALVIPREQRHVARIAEMVRLTDFLAVHESREAALESFR